MVYARPGSKLKFGVEETVYMESLWDFEALDVYFWIVNVGM